MPDEPADRPTDSQPIAPAEIPVAASGDESVPGWVREALQGDIDTHEDEPTPELVRELLCARIESLAPNLAARIREATLGAEDYGAVLLIASLEVAKEGGSDLDDLIGLDAFLLSLGIQVEAGSERKADLVKPGPQTVDEVVKETREGLFRKCLFDTCNGLIPEGQRAFLLTTDPCSGDSFEVALYNIAVIWITEALYERMDKGPMEALPSKAAKGREKKRLEGMAREQAIATLTRKGMINPADEA
ncbi:MAG: hypothetical protein WC924_03100 [Candidatus Gracilibacteria bacterium]